MSFAVSYTILVVVNDPHIPTASSLTMFNINITASFSGAYPSSISVSVSAHKSAIQFYKVRLRAKVVSWTSRSAAILDSTYGFRIRIDRSSSSGAQSSVRLSLHPSVDRLKLAKSLSAGGRVRTSRSGLVVTDPYGVTWTIA